MYHTSDRNFLPVKCESDVCIKIHVESSNDFNDLFKETILERFYHPPENNGGWGISPSEFDQKYTYLLREASHLLEQFSNFNTHSILLESLKPRLEEYLTRESLVEDVKAKFFSTTKNF